LLRCSVRPARDLFPKRIVNAGSFAKYDFSQAPSGRRQSGVDGQIADGQFLYVAKTGSPFITQIGLESNAAVRSIPSEIGLQSLGIADLR
jgi:hypothetical protein